MIQQFLEWLNTIGIAGLFLSMFLEGSSLPFPGLVIVLSYGYLLSPGYINTAFIALGMSIFYTLASLIPYFIGAKLERHLPKKLKKGLEKGIVLFNRYGIWSIALSRPFGIGNYISYVAGIGKVNLFKYFILTFLGIYPWSYVMILLGNYFKGNYETFKDYFSSYGIYVYLFIAVILIFIGLLFYYKKSKQRNVELSDLGEGGRSK
ncbi:DedA family protein [Bacillus sp. FSL K6-3431]|uniref:DedA family protein n=1 Tax=Bacillus sp. FSL K6-3431 TaxID=2921500 RepID=UPI0030F98685